MSLTALPEVFVYLCVSVFFVSVLGDIQVLQMNLEHSKAQTQRALSQASQAHAAAEEYKYKVKAAERGNDSSGFVMGNVQASIEEAVKEIKMLPEDERKKQIKALRFRWHPDNNPVLTEFATEVSKTINAAVKGMEADLGGGGGAKDSTFC